MKINLIAGLVLAVLVVFGGGCASRMSQMDVSDRVEIPVVLEGKVYTNTFVHTDRSRIAPGGPRTLRHGGGSFFGFNATVGGGGPRTYGGGGYGYPVITVPLESQPAFQHQTMERYGLGGGYSHAPAGSYSPTPMVGGGGPAPQHFYGYSTRP